MYVLLMKISILVTFIALTLILVIMYNNDNNDNDYMLIKTEVDTHSITILGLLPILHQFNNGGTNIECYLM